MPEKNRVHNMPEKNLSSASGFTRPGNVVGPIDRLSIYCQLLWVWWNFPGESSWCLRCIGAVASRLQLTDYAVGSLHRFSKTGNWLKIVLKNPASGFTKPGNVVGPNDRFSICCKNQISTLYLEKWLSPHSCPHRIIWHFCGAVTPDTGEWRGWKFRTLF